MENRIQYAKEHSDNFLVLRFKKKKIREQFKNKNIIYSINIMRNSLEFLFFSADLIYTGIDFRQEIRYDEMIENSLTSFTVMLFRAENWL